MKNLIAQCAPFFEENNIICLMGPTASGKTDLAIELTQHFPCDIISVDSAMVYKGMDIGTAKPSFALQQFAPHRLIDIRDPLDSYSAGTFRVDALAQIQNILANNRIPLLVGGTMMYFYILMNGLADLPQADATLRANLELKAKTIGWPALHAKLKIIDPHAFERIHPFDGQRIQRALEVYYLSGKSLTEWQQEKKKARENYKYHCIGLIPPDRTVLHQRIANRFHDMLQHGFLAEVTNLYERGDLHLDLPAIRSVGYKEAWGFLKGRFDYATMRENAIIATRQLAKRQLTWLRHWPKLHLLKN